MNKCLLKSLPKLISLWGVMIILLLCFAHPVMAQEEGGWPRQIEVPEGTSVEDVMRRFDVETDNTNVILVNGHSPSPDQELNEGDVVCAFPSMAGG